jgi:adenylate cyclase
LPEHQSRRLAAILAADIAGYSSLMGADEARTVSDLKGHQAAILPMIGEFGGRVIDTAGDGILAEFPSVVGAVDCSVAIQKIMTERNIGIEPERRMQFRVGIDLGDVIYDDNRIFGDGINVAARLEGIAEPGGICVSGKVHEEVRGKTKFAYDDLGEHRLKNIAQTVRVYSVRPHGAATRSARPLPNKPSIAVLPFQNMSGDPEQEYFADGMVEDIITGLSRIKWLFVIARNSGFAYKGKSIDVKQVGQELGVRYVLEGSVRRAANRVRITCQLIEAQTGAHLRAERYDRPLDDIFAIQDEITLSVVGAIEPSLRQAEIERTKRKRPDSLDAYDLVLQALPHAYTAMPEGAAKAIPLIERALALEPDYPLAHGIAAWGHHILFNRAGMREENRRSAIHHAHEAITHGRDDAMALTLGGFVVSMVEHDRAAAVEAFEAALGVSPSAAFTYFFGSCALGLAGEAERPIDWGERGLRLSPYDALTFMPWLGISLAHFQRGRYAEAIDAARRSIQSNPHLSTTHAAFAAALAKSGRIDEARAAIARALALQPKLAIGGMCAAFGIPPSLATPLSEALHTSGLPQ